MTTWSAFILAGGQGRRLDGRVKPLVAVGGRTILARQIEACAGFGVRPTLVAADAAPFAGMGLDVIPDAVAAGALGGLYTALAHAATDRVIVLAGDLPFVTAPFLTFVSGLAGGHDAVVPAPDGRWHPLCAAYHPRIAPRLREAIDAVRWRVVDALAGLDVRLVTAGELRTVDPDGRLLLNVNTPDDLRRADARAVP